MAPARGLEITAMRRYAFNLLVEGALALSVLLVLALLGAQAGYIGPTKAFRALADPEIRRALFLSLGTSTLAAVLALVFAIPAGYGLARFHFRGKWAVDLLLDLPMVLSPVAIGVSLLLLFRTMPGQWIENHLLRFVFEVPGIILAQFVVALALSIRIIKAVFQETGERHELVARFLGCTPWGAFRKVALPMAKRGILAAFILSWARSLAEFGATVTLAGAVPGKTETAPVAIYLRLSQMDIGGAVGLMMVLSAIGLLVLLGVRLLGGGLR